MTPLPKSPFPRRRGALEMCEEIANLQDRIVRDTARIGQVKAEVEEYTGMEYERFLSGMRELLMPVSAFDEAVTVHRRRAELGGG